MNSSKNNEPRKENGNGSPRKPNVEIREMEIDDLATVFHLGERLFTAREVPNLYRTWDEFEIVELYNADTELCLVAALDDEHETIIGFALGTTVSKNRSAWKYGHLVWLGVEPAYQKLGVAERLFRQLQVRMEEEGVRIVLVDTEADNRGALSFFKKLGFSSPEEHIYLSLNLETMKKREKNGGILAMVPPETERKRKGRRKA